MSPFPPSFNSNSVCIRTRPCYSLPTIGYPLSHASCFDALTNPSSNLINLQVLYSHTLTNPFFSQPLSFLIYTKPPGCRGCAPSSTLRSLCLSVEKPPNSFPDIPLRTLEISLLSFATSRPLFSIGCRLFLQNTGGMGGSGEGGKTCVE